MLGRCIRWRIDAATSREGDRLKIQGTTTKNRVVMKKISPRTMPGNAHHGVCL